MSLFEIVTIALLVWLLYEVRFGKMEIKERHKRWLEESYEYELAHLGKEEASRRHAERLLKLKGRGVWERIKKVCGVA